MRNWIYFFDQEHQKRIDLLRSSNQEPFKTWSIFTIVLPISAYILSVALNFLLKGFNDWGEIINNGSLPIISFGFISSGIPYILEKMERDDQIIDALRKRVMAIAVLLMFLTSAWFVLQTTSIFHFKVGGDINSWRHLIVFAVATLLAYYAVRCSIKLFLLQRKIADKDYDLGIHESKRKHGGPDWD